MLRNNVTFDPHEWFALFRDEFYEHLGSGAIAHIRPCRDDLHEVTFGWYTRVARLDTDPNVTFEIWFDTYLDASGPHHLGCWYEAGWKTIEKLIKPLGTEWGVKIPVYQHLDREDDWAQRLRPQVGQREASRIPAPFVDHWANWGYAGLYAVNNPMRVDLTAALNQTSAGLRRLVNVVRIERNDARSLGKSNLEDVEERQRRTVSVLVRDGQRTARQFAFDRFGACVISGETVPEALEAAHIRPVHDSGSDTMNNILLLRADLHRLFDAGLLTIANRQKPCVKIARSVLKPGSSYPSLSTLAVDHSKISTGQWLALDTRNSQWDEDLGLTNLPRRTAKGPLMRPSPA